MFRYYTALMLLSLLMLTSCSNNVSKGDDYLKQNKPDFALRYYQKALEKTKDDPVIIEKMVWANLMLAENIIPRGQLERARYNIEYVKKNIKKDAPLELKRKYASVLALLGETLKKENKLTEALETLEKALEIDKTNETARRVMDESRLDYAKLLMEKAREALTTKEYGVAEWNIKKAQEYNPKIPGADKLLRKVRKQGLATYDLNQDVLLAISDADRKSYKTFLRVYIQNNYEDELFTVKPQYFTLYDKRGNTYGYKSDIYGGYASRKIRVKELRPLDPKSAETNGLLAFGISRKRRLAKLVFDDGKGHKAEKYFP